MLGVGIGEETIKGRRGDGGRDGKEEMRVEANTKCKKINNDRLRNIIYNSRIRTLDFIKK